MSRQRGKRTVGDYRHYPPEYVKPGDGVTIDRTDPIYPVIHADDQGGITEIVPGDNISVDNTDPKKPVVSTDDAVSEVQGSSHIIVDNTDPKKPVISTSGLVDKVHGADQIIVDNIDENNPIVKTTGLVESIAQKHSSIYENRIEVQQPVQHSFTINAPVMVDGREAYLSNTVTIPAATWTYDLGFDSYRNAYGTSTGAATEGVYIVNEGNYIIELTVALTGYTGVNEVYLGIARSGVLMGAYQLSWIDSSNSNDIHSISISRMVYCSAGKIIEGIMHTSVACSLQNETRYTLLRVYRVN